MVHGSSLMLHRKGHQTEHGVTRCDNMTPSDRRLGGQSANQHPSLDREPFRFACAWSAGFRSGQFASEKRAIGVSSFLFRLWRFHLWDSCGSPRDYPREFPMEMCKSVFQESFPKVISKRVFHIAFKRYPQERSPLPFPNGVFQKKEHIFRYEFP